MANARAQEGRAVPMIWLKHPRLLLEALGYGDCMGAHRCAVAFVSRGSVPLVGHDTTATVQGATGREPEVQDARCCWRPAIVMIEYLLLCMFGFG